MTYRNLYRRIFLIDYASSLNISLSDENVFGSWQSFSTFKAHIFLQIKETGRKYKMATWHCYQTKSFQPLSCWTQVVTRDPWVQLIFLNDCCRTNFFWIGWTWTLLRLLNNQTHCLFFQTGKTLSFLVWPCLLNS